MKTKEKILTLHPQGKNGVNIDREKYDTLRSYILQSLTEGPLSYQDLNENAIKDLSPTFEGKVAWYLVTVKLDLEARNEIVRIPGSGPHKVKLAR